MVQNLPVVCAADKIETQHGHRFADLYIAALQCRELSKLRNTRPFSSLCLGLLGSAHVHFCTIPHLLNFANM